MRDIEKYFYYRQRDKAIGNVIRNSSRKIGMLLYKLALGIYFSRRSD